MTDTETGQWQATPERLLWLTAGLVLVVLPHAQRIPPWTVLAFVLFAGWRLASATRGFRVPRGWLRTVFGVAVLAGVLVSFGTLLGRVPGVAMLVVLAGLKLLETKALRDAFVVSFLGYFLVITNFLFSQSIPTALYMFAVVLVMTATQIRVTTSRAEIGELSLIGLAGKLLLQALPIMLMLFVLFPRVPDPLWGLPKDAHGGISGLSDAMTPGNISRLALSDDVAFRTAFNGDAPPPAKLYWRGPVLWDTDGREWTTNTRAPYLSQSPIQGLGKPVEYTVTLEPHHQRWLLALDAPASIPRGQRISEDLQVMAAGPVRTLQRYRVQSYTDYRNRRLTARQRQRALALPAGFHPRARALAQRWREELQTNQAVISRALDHFREQPFFYTLNPPLLEGDSVDEFLFRTRRGFCEHYAAAFTVLMRAAGIPARVVTGYQGGEMNPLSDYMIVRQRDAHAWVEVWQDAQGWERVDPTAAVSPGRIESGLEAVVPRAVGAVGLRLESSAMVRRFWRTLGHGWDAVNNRWNQWVVGYGARRQTAFLARLGFDIRDWQHVALGLSVSVGLALMVVAWWLLRIPKKRDPAVRAYERFCRKLTRRGVSCRPSEGPLDFGERVVLLRPDLSSQVERIVSLYVGVRYGGSDAYGKSLREAVAAFQP